MALTGAFFLILLCTLTLATYWPGLSGAFLFDDYANLPDLGKLGTVHSLETALQYATGGTAGPLGRPVALLSFLIDDNSWPGEPYSFKLTNLKLHLLTGLLLIWLGTLLGRELSLDANQGSWIGLLTGALWLLHPLWVSTTLFVVQRMTILAALFTLAALICYVKGRQRLNTRRSVSGYGLMTLGTGGFGLLAVLSKENAALLPVFLVLIEYLVFRPEQRRGLPCWHVWRWCLWLPVAVLITYFGLHMSRDGSFPHRPFHRAERLLTEGRILIDYLHNLVLPSMQTGGLYHDDYTISHGLLEPPTTLVALLCIAALIGGALYWRKAAPTLALGVLFFFSGHLVESTIIGLELYFEHRNYLPATLLFLPLGYGIVALYRRYRLLAICLASALLLIYSGLTWSRATLWDNPLQLALVWADRSPYSVRSQQQAALALVKADRTEQARMLLSEAIKRMPNSAALRLQETIYACTLHDLSAEQLNSLQAALRQTIYHPHLYNLLDQLVQLQTRHRCLEAPRLHDIIDTLAANPSTRAWSTGYARMFHLHGKLYLGEEHHDEALAKFDRAFAITPDDDIALVQAALLASASQHALALKHLDTAQSFYESIESAEHSRDWRRRFKELKQAIHTHAPEHRETHAD